MALIPTLTERLARARADLRMGVAVILTAESEAVLIIAAETMNAERFADLRALSKDIALTITARRAETLKARCYDADIARVKVPQDADIKWVRSLADPADDLLHPMKGPLQTLRDGQADLHRTGIRMAKDAQVLPAVLVVPLKNPKEFAAAHDLTTIDTAATAPLLEASLQMAPVVHARLPMTVSEAGRLHVFRPDDGSVEHYAVEVGRPDRDKPVLARLHSACFTGDVIGSLKCDCGPQLRGALEQMGSEGEGILLYLNQEGRGIGLANKMRAYSLQDQGFDTVEANHRLGFEDDERDFRIGAEILKKLGFDAVRLLTNNPAKVARMEETGVKVVERVELRVGENPHNSAYLGTKAAKSGHLL
ncbi:GTP cyclohydrolase II [Cochlodiniinecator piscidefendens]|uniref:GTP cyclohydrolase II n=1 Tax=Cochlodiniinecator piscidefendens TaxID=2715756 RepID=UPI00140743B2|nr:GTP cyclohydrolase II [Cochlodiniinecator piscidefendens]